MRIRGVRNTIRRHTLEGSIISISLGDQMEQIMYCHKIWSENWNDWLYKDICSSTKTVERYGKGEIIKILVKSSDKKERYMAWVYSGEESFCMIYPSTYFNICFAYGYKAEEERGKGIMHYVIIEEI